MYKIYKNKKIIQETILPCYIYYDEKINSYRTCEEEQATHIFIQKEDEEAEILKINEVKIIKED